MKSIIISVITLLICSFNLFSQNNDYNSIFNRANQLYQAKDYSSAVVEYKKLIDAGIESPEVYFNLANSYYRIRKTAESVYYYEKARKLAPDDADIEFNLHIANLRVVDKFETVPKIFLREWYEAAISNYPSSFWGIISIISIWITLGLITMFLFVWNMTLKKGLFAGAVLTLLLFIASLVLTFESTAYENKRNEAIVFSSSVYVKSSPDESSTDLFILHEGTKISIQDNVDDWLKIKLPNGTIGWLKSDNIKII